MENLALICHFTIMLVFSVSAIGKVRRRAAFDEFARTTRTMLSAAVPKWSVRRAGLRRIAGAVVAAELAIPVLVGVPPSTRWGHGLCIVLLAVFSIGMIAVIRRGVTTSCSCFGTASGPLGVPHLVRNALLAGAAATGLVVGPVEFAQAGAGLAVAAAAAAVLTLLVTRLDDVIALFTQPASTRRMP